MGNSITCSINCDSSITATLCSVVYMVCFRYVIVNTVHRGGGGDHNGNAAAADNNNSNNNNNIALVV